MKKFLLAMIAFLMLSGCGQPISTTETGISLSPVSPLVTPNPGVSAQLPAGQPPVSDEACLPPLTTFAFPNGETNITPPPQSPVLPPSEWRLVSTLPNFDKLSEYRLALISYDDQYSDIWILANNGQGLFQYRTDTKEWSVNKTTNASTSSLLFLDSEGNVWSARVDTLASIPFLSRYDKEKGEFIPVYDNGDTWNLTVSSVKVDDEGIFWMMVNNRGVHQLTSFNPSTLKATIQLESPDYGYSLEISPDNKILFGDQKDNSIIAYSPTTGKVDSYKIPLTVYFGSYIELFLDSYGRLWVNDFGWMDLSGSTPHQWFTVVRSPVFIDFPEGIGQWAWPRPTFSTESPDGLLWFRTIRGTGWLDTKTGTWCLFTTYDSDILQDREHTLWMLADGKLFERFGNP
jgi:hypothetical protein